MPIVLSAIKDWSLSIAGARLELWIIFLIVAATVGLLVLVSYLLDRSNPSRFAAVHVGGKELGMFPEEMWEPYQRFLWKLTLGYVDRGKRRVLEALGPFCPKCRTEMVIETKGGLLGTAIGSEDYWKCPQCGKTLKATRDEDDLQDEVKKRVQGRIDRGEI